MNRNPPIDPFDSSRQIGTIFEVGPISAKVILSQRAADLAEVGEFVVVDCGDRERAWVLFGRLIGVQTPGRAATSSSDHGGPQPTAEIELLTTISADGSNALRGIERFPHPGSRVYSAPPALLSWLFACSQVSTVGQNGLEPVVLNVVSLADGAEVGLAPERAFGRHCAIVGATGVGKSWTMARLIEESARYAAKMILFDSTGEFHTLKFGVRHVHIGTDPSKEEPSREAAMPHHDLTESDLFALFKPSGPTQAPKLRAAIKSLKLARVPHLATGGVVLKAGKLKAPYEAAYTTLARELENPRATFDIAKLPAQIDAECVFPTGGFTSTPDHTRWGVPNEIERSNCINLITRIEDMLRAPELSCVFKPGKAMPIFEEIDSFLADPAARVLRISLKYLPFVHDAREIVANAIGRHMLGLARDKAIGERPLVLLLDEAHHFLNRTGDEQAAYPLDSFDLIAKEGRKLSLNFCIATQRPRDIPEGVLSQIGTFIIHRLNNQLDRAALESACSDADRSVMAFIPGLGEGQAVIIGADLPLPIVVRIVRPRNPPDSRGPDYQMHWRSPVAPAPVSAEAEHRQESGTE
jgi:uncharacterized protein